MQATQEVQLAVHRGAHLGEDAEAVTALLQMRSDEAQERSDRATAALEESRKENSAVRIRMEAELTEAQQDLANVKEARMATQEALRSLATIKP
jgi:hypothetical protein